MTATERFINLLNGKTVDRPPFLPAIYDLKPILAGCAPHTFGQKKEEVINALLYEATELDADALTVGYDIYNVEAELAGCHVTRSADLSMPEIAQPLLTSLNAIKQLKAPVQPAGRMNLFIEAADYMLNKFENKIPVRGGVSGPFSMASKLYDQNALLVESLTEPGKLMPLMRFCTDTIKTYIKGFSEVGAGVVVFDSFVSPPLISPETYRELVMPFHKELFLFLNTLGVGQNALIIGGNTLSLLKDLSETGARQLLLDYNIPLEKIKAVLSEFPGHVFRVNLSPEIFFSIHTNEMIKTIEKTLLYLKDHQNIIIGTGILSNNVPPKNLILAKELIVNFYR